MDQTVRSYTTIEINGKPFQVRTFIVGREGDGKKTLVFTHGYVTAIVNYMYVLVRLASTYRLVLFDNCCKGLNTRLGDDDVPPELLADP